MTMRFRKTKPVPRVEGPIRAAAYLRVSTGRQAESDLSIPDQRRQIAAYCAANGWQLMSEYVEPGASGMDDARPEFQKMIERAGDSDYPFDVIVVHSFSRFFRDGFGLEMYVRKLAKSGVRLVSITQQLGEDPSHALMRQMIGMFDGYQSLENGKHVSRAMKENARQGFYNGSRPPLGYMTQEVEKRGNRVKKRLVVDPVEAETVRLIFGLYRGGDGKSGPLGIKALTCWLNERGYRTRLGVRFGVGTVHKILVNRVYIGEWVFNRRCSKTQIEKPKAEHIPIAVPAIIERAEFDAVAASLKSNNPRVTPPRVVTGPVLLTGLATCATCSGPMTSRTGTSKSGKVYWYYSCSTHGRQGKFACTGHSIAMDTLDTLVIDHLVTELLQPDRLRATLAALWTSRIEKAAQVDGRVGALRTEITNAEDKLKRLYTMVEDGVTDLDDILRERLSVLKLDRDRAKAALDRIRITAQPAVEIASNLLERFGQMMRENITSGEIPFRKAWIQTIVDCVEIDADVIRIIGDKASLTNAISDGAAASQAGVRSSVRKWRALRESNPPFQRERLTS